MRPRSAASVDLLGAVQQVEQRGVRHLVDDLLRLRLVGAKPYGAGSQVELGPAVEDGVRVVRKPVFAAGGIHFPDEKIAILKRPAHSCSLFMFERANLQCGFLVRQPAPSSATRPPPRTPSS